MLSSSFQPLQKPEGNSIQSINFEKEYAAVRASAGLFTLRDYGKIAIRGKDRVKFLQGITSNDISTLKEGSSLYTIFPTVKGKIASEGVVWAFSDFLLVILRPDLRDKTLGLLKKFKIGSDAQLEDVTEQFALYSIQGPRSAEILATGFLQPLAELQPFHFATFLLNTVPIRVIRNDWSGETGFDLLIPAANRDQVIAKLLALGSSMGLLSAGAETFETVRVESGMPLYGYELSEEVLPQEAGLESKAISYTKGCYIGQETIARLHYLGHANRALTGILSDQTILAKGDTIHSGEKHVGLITSSLFSPFLQRVISLGYLNRQFIAAGTLVEVSHQGQHVKAEVTSLPFFKHEPMKR